MAPGQAAPGSRSPTHRCVEVEGLKLHFWIGAAIPTNTLSFCSRRRGARAFMDGVAPLLTPYGRVLALDFRCQARPMGEVGSVRPAGISEGRARPYREPRRAHNPDWPFDRRAVTQSVAVTHPELLERSSSSTRRTGHPTLSPPDVAMAPGIDRGVRPELRFGQRHHPEISPAAAPDEFGAAGIERSRCLAPSSFPVAPGRFASTRKRGPGASMRKMRRPKIS